ncbi:DNA-binding response regulator [Commensalibacter communis]|uniref:OmpR family n=1 Tax=Commensalibacter communis TaxID=2972786 RepID=A0A9W4TNA6_9PROT|nr:response regulator transcription factor [Commensalibacter communis]CAI3938716.1 DNA-binding response regulator [Commensalibacter communis]CAI3938912.1 DNA-binding response regulator [Commensalibacter communis]CAI3939502.1 DNA-binding response regulator [Commensalibacter communis]CAI3941444.1 DNA-binding response regulator [Commensalibacter communis]CAI3942037.1 DNA-binding response regulator [Commensalibacter communis]
MHVLLMGETFFSEHEFYQELKATGFSIDRVGYDPQILSASQFYDYDMIIVELDQLDKQFFSTIKLLRSINEQLPIIIVSKKDDVDMKIQAFQAGIDDYVMIPFAMPELLARCKAVLRRSNKVIADRVIQVGQLKINLETREVFVNGKPVNLTGKEYAILEMLVLRRDVLISKITILNDLYAGSSDEPDMKIIDVFVCKLRKKLQKAGAGDLISTMWGQGYIFRQPSPLATEREHAI